LLLAVRRQLRWQLRLLGSWHWPGQQLLTGTAVVACFFLPEVAAACFSLLQLA